MQQSLFDLPNTVSQPEPTKELSIGKQGNKILSKQQKDFNRLVKKIEKLRSDIKRNADELSGALDYYVKEMHPLEQRVVELRINGAKLFYPFFKDKKLLSKKDKNILGQVISSGLNELFSFSSDEPDDEIKTIFKAVNGVSFDEAKKTSFDEMMGEMEGMFEEMGMDVNLDGFNENMTEAEVARKMKEMHEAFMTREEEEEAKNAGKKKTKKQQAREDKEKLMEDARKKNIGTIYKQLAKAFHPDLETDPELKLGKEEMMKQLTVAYEKNDLHTLLKLEIEWMQKEENDLDSLSNEKLSIYNEVLKEQTMELEQELQMQQQHPRFMPLQRYARLSRYLVLLNLKNQKQELEEKVLSLEDSEAELKGKNALGHVKEIIRYNQKNDVLIDLDDMDALMEDFFRRQ